MEARSVAYAGVSAALLSVSAWVAIPFGPVPFTLQTLALAILPAALRPVDAVASVVLYVLVGAIGLPVFAGFQGGVGVLAGPTGGFLWGFILGMVTAAVLMRVLPDCLPLFGRALIADATMLLISYVCGTVQLMAVGSMGVAPALAAAVLPFIIPDAIKLAVGARIGCSVRKALAAGRR